MIALGHKVIAAGPPRCDYVYTNDQIGLWGDAMAQRVGRGTGKDNDGDLRVAVGNTSGLASD